MKVTVITVCWNAEATIGDTLDSVAAQTHPDVEHIVVDGGSTDATLEIVRARGAHVAKVISEPDDGLYDAMNKGWRAATGDYVGFLHADDIYADPGAVARIAATAAASQADFVLADVDIVERDNTDRSLRYYASRGFSRRWFEQGDMPPHPGAYHRRELFERHGGYDTSYRLSADFDFFARLLYLERCTYALLPGAVVKMRVGGASSQGPMSNVRLLKDVLRACRKHRIPVTPFSLLAKYWRKARQYALFTPPASAR